MAWTLLSGLSCHCLCFVWFQSHKTSSTVLEFPSVFVCLRQKDDSVLSIAFLPLGTFHQRDSVPFHCHKTGKLNERRLNMKVFYMMFYAYLVCLWSHSIWEVKKLIGKEKNNLYFRKMGIWIWLFYFLCHCYKSLLFILSIISSNI